MPYAHRPCRFHCRAAAAAPWLWGGGAFGDDAGGGNRDTQNAVLRIDPDLGGRAALRLDIQPSCRYAAPADLDALSIRDGDVRPHLAAGTRDHERHASVAAAHTLCEEIVMMRHPLVSDDRAVTDQILAHLLAGGPDDARAEAAANDPPRDPLGVAALDLKVVGGGPQRGAGQLERRDDLLAAAVREDDATLCDHHRAIALAALADRERLSANLAT